MDRTKANIINPTIECKNCLNDDVWDTCPYCNNYNLFLGLKQAENGFVVLKTKECTLESTAENLLQRIESERRMRSQQPMFGGRLIDNIY